MCAKSYTSCRVCTVSAHTVSAHTVSAQEGKLAVASPPMPASSAEKAGIRKGDLVSAINGINTDKASVLQHVQQQGGGVA